MGKVDAMGKWSNLGYFGKMEVVRWILGNLVVYWPKWIFGRRYFGWEICNGGKKLQGILVGYFGEEFDLVGFGFLVFGWIDFSGGGKLQGENWG